MSQCISPGLSLRRISAFAIDALCAAVPLVILVNLAFADLCPGETAESRTRLAVIVASILGAVFIVQLGMFARSQSVGKFLLRLRVVNAEGRGAGYFRTLARWVLRLLGTWGAIPLVVTLPLVLVQAVLFFRRGWTFWDALLRTTVVYSPPQGGAHHADRLSAL